MIDRFALSQRSHKLTGYQLSVVLLSELELIARHNESDDSWTLNQDSLTAPLHIDCSFKVLRILNEILSLISSELKSKSTITMMTDVDVQDTDLLHHILYHGLRLLMVQVGAVDHLKITIDNFCIPSYRIKEIKSMLLTVIRSLDVPQSIVEVACKTLVKGQKLFFATVNSKLIYLLALLLRQEELEDIESKANSNGHSMDKSMERSKCKSNTNNTRSGTFSEDMDIGDTDCIPNGNPANAKLIQFLRDFSDDLVDPLSSITGIEIEVTLPVMLNQFGSVGQPSQFIDSLLTSEERSNGMNRSLSGMDDDEQSEEQENQSRKLFFGTLQMLVSNCSIDIDTLRNRHSKRGMQQRSDERMGQLLLDLQSMLLFRYQSTFESGQDAVQQFSDQTPISLQKLWSKMYQHSIQIETKEQRDIDECLFQYAKHVMTISTQILQEILDTASTATNTSINTTDSAEDEGELAFFFENDCQILHRSFFGKITIPLMTNLLELIEGSTKDTPKQKLFKHLMRNKVVHHLLTPHISNLLEIIDSILTKSARYCKSNKMAMKYHTVTETKESPHPYVSGQIIKKLVTIPGAKELVVKFDHSLCATASERDFLQIFTKNSNGYVAVSGQLSGASNKWPERMTVPGDSCLLYFISDHETPKEEAAEESKSDSGFKVDVEGEVPVNPMEKVL